MVKDTYTFKSNYSVKISLTNNPHEIHYRFFNNEHDEIKVMVAGLPTHVTDRSQLLTQIKKAINPNGNVKTQELQQVTIELQNIVNTLKGEAEIKAIHEKQDLNLQIRKKSHEAKKFMQTLNDPLLYIGSIVDWLTAGERINTLICFCAGCSQVVLNEPVSVIGYGESSSGKTFVQNVALSLLPEEFIVVEKQVSPAALFNRSARDTRFYDGKIVSYGDMGGQNDRDNVQETLDLMKELQTDGKLVKPVSVKQDDGKWGVEDLILEGKPSLWYTTVPTDIDGQELSRAIVYSPRTDNKSIFHRRGKMLSLKRGRTYSKFQTIEQKSEMIKHMVLHLREVMQDYIIINPFYNIIADILNESKYYKRDTDKYLHLLDTITAINFYQNQKYTFNDGQKAVITSKNDVQLLLSLLEPYMSSITVNIKPKSVEVYETIKSNIDEWKQYKGADIDGYNDAGFQIGITIRDYFEKSNTDIPMSSLNRYFSDLYQAGLLTIVGKENNRANMYDIVEYDFRDTIQQVDFEGIVEDVEFELGVDVAEVISEDVIDEDLSILGVHDLVEVSPW